MNLKDLNNININDLKNIDWRQVKSRLQSRPDLIINILLIVATLTIVFSAYRKYTTVIKSLAKEKKELSAKSEMLEKLELTRKLYNDFIQDIPEIISGDQMIEALSDFAIERNVQILSFSPAKEESNKFVHLTRVEVHVSSESYANIILFMHDIESSPFSIRTEMWSGSSVTPSGTSQRRSRRSIQQITDETKEHIEATIKIESLELKNV